MSAQIVTDQSLLAKLKRAAGVPVSRHQLHTQRVSFIYGNLPHDSTITRAQIETTLNRIEGEPEPA